MLRLLKWHFPKSEIYWWIDFNLLPLVEDDPDLAGFFVFYRKRWASPLYWNEMLRSILEMRRKKFDWVIDLQGLARSGMFAWLANGGLTIGVADPREGASGFYDIAVPRPSSQTHAVDWYLSILKSLAVPAEQKFIWLPPNTKAQKTIQLKWNAGNSRWIAINPGARWMNKRWPVEYFAELVKRLASQNPLVRFVILGSKADQHLGEIISHSEPARCLDLTGKTSLMEMIEWVRLSEYIVTNDTGPMHVAAALNKPVAAIFGPTDPQRTGAYGQTKRSLRVQLPCSPCLKAFCSYHRPLECLRAVTPDLVEREIRRAIENAL